jgi:hypothetical protein
MVVEQIVTPRNVIVNFGFASVDNEFPRLAICSTTLSAMCYLYNIDKHDHILTNKSNMITH